MTTIIKRGVIAQRLGSSLKQASHWPWVGWVILLTIAVCMYSRRPVYRVRTFRTSAGWGYEIRRGDRPLIYQPIMPGRSGRSGFTDETHARRVGDIVLAKLEAGQFPPTLQPEELK